MIPLIVLGLLVSAGLAAYEFSPRAHTWVDDHVAALRALFGALRAANAHVDAARTATDPAVIADQTRAAQAAHAEAARQVTVAAQTAQTQQERDNATRSAGAVEQLGAAIAALSNLVSSGALVDAHTLGMLRAIAAHAAADAHLAAAQVHIAAPQATPGPAHAAEHAIAARAANQEADQANAAAAANARTLDQHAVVDQSAATTAARTDKIASVFATLGVGICGVRSYSGVSARTRDALIAKLRAAGMAVSGKNPWDIDTGMLDIKLRAAWDSRAQELKLIVTGGNSALCDLIWARVDPKMKEARGA